MRPRDPDGPAVRVVWRTDKGRWWWFARLHDHDRSGPLRSRDVAEMPEALMEMLPRPILEASGLEVSFDAPTDTIAAWIRAWRRP